MFCGCGNSSKRNWFRVSAADEGDLFAVGRPGARVIGHVQRLRFQQGDLAGFQIADMQSRAAEVFWRSLRQQDARAVRMPAEVGIGGFFRENAEAF